MEWDVEDAAEAAEADEPAITYETSLVRDLLGGTLAEGRRGHALLVLRADFEEYVVNRLADDTAAKAKAHGANAAAVRRAWKHAYDAISERALRTNVNYLFHHQPELHVAALVVVLSGNLAAHHWRRVPRDIRDELVQRVRDAVMVLLRADPNLFNVQPARASKRYQDTADDLNSLFGPGNELAF